MEEIEVKARVSKLDKPTAIVDYLSTRFTYLTAEQWLALINQGKISIGGDIVSAATIVSNGMLLLSQLPAPPADIPPYSIVYEDDWLIAVNKPAGLRVHGTGRFTRANLIYHLRQNLSNTAKLINRLDSDTSGIVLIAKQDSLLKAVQKQFAEQKVEKTYLAYVHGAPTFSGSIGYSLREGKKDARNRYIFTDPAGSLARTDFTFIETVADEISLVELRPRTGRTHQLRVHLAAINHPIVGDRQYGHLDDRSQFKLERHLLHCQRTTFFHPGTKQTITVTAPLPADFHI